VTGRASETGRRIADELASCDVKLIASLPDNWLMERINTVARDDRFVHVPVNREESAIGLCSGAYMGAMGSAALMGDTVISGAAFVCACAATNAISVPPSEP